MISLPFFNILQTLLSGTSIHSMSNLFQENDGIIIQSVTVKLSSNISIYINYISTVYPKDEVSNNINKYQYNTLNLIVPGIAFISSINCGE